MTEYMSRSHSISAWQWTNNPDDNEKAPSWITKAFMSGNLRFEEGLQELLVKDSFSNWTKVEINNWIVKFKEDGRLSTFSSEYLGKNYDPVPESVKTRDRI